MGKDRWHLICKCGAIVNQELFGEGTIKCPKCGREYKIVFNPHKDRYELAE